ncbi:hypothetical protein EA735_18005 [Acinetobacter baumannii]|nr:hypothetical protein EA735_18005 [Acinetobacter baumannii]
MPAFEWVHVQLHQQKGMISLSPPTICNSASLGEASPMVVSIYTWEKAGLISQLVDHMTTVLHDRFQSGS